MEIKAVLFDLDQTLMDRTGSLRHFVKWQAESVLKLPLGQQQNFLKRFLELDANGRVWKDVVYTQLIEELGLSGWTMPQLLSMYVASFYKFCQPHQGVVEAVKLLKNMDLKLGLVSNGYSPFQERNFEALGIADLFDAVIVSAAVGYRKPDPEIFNIACQQLKVTNKQCAFVGDNPIADILGANNVGMFSIFYSPDCNTNCNTAHAVLHNFYDLPALIKQCNAE